MMAFLYHMERMLGAKCGAFACYLEQMSGNAEKN